ncbi:Gfo/Idh/MocA family protein [Haploplasma axanthum]|uniref:Putative oxidoreductase n=1 Tax=Haploplasma axanthum TaxID=29552 RepID=A0A449BBL0_HAPAX|nr:Gfo/Idh/MocA family oxidoreductase [Haploplasma axanthum]VEU79833.1 putative oxidoreductase [Haploplasma axanthum]
MRTAIIGFGIIGKKYLEAINKETSLEIKYISNLEVVDVINIKYIKDYTKIPLDDIDIVFVTTPPNTHYEIANYFLSNGKKVFVEKPATIDKKDFEKLYQEFGDRFNVVYHWMYGDEVLFLKNNDLFLKNFDEIVVHINDPYYTDEGILKKHFGGAWLDSGVNVLSMLSIFVNLDKYKLYRKYREVDDDTNQDYVVTREYLCNDSKIVVNINWDNNSNMKNTIIKNDYEMIEIDHTNQVIKLNGKIVFESKVEDRLLSHYENFFKSFKSYKNDIKITKLIHDKLFE